MQVVEYQLALATAPSSDVTVTTSTSWLEGLPKELQGGLNVTFASGEALVWKRVSFVVPYNVTYLGTALLGITHAALSSDRLYNTGMPQAAPALEVHSHSGVQPHPPLHPCCRMYPWEYCFRFCTAFLLCLDSTSQSTCCLCLFEAIEFNACTVIYGSVLCGTPTAHRCG